MITTDNNVKQWLTPEEIAVVLGVPKSWVYQQTMRGKKGLPFIKVGRFLRFDKDKVLSFFEKQSGL